MGAATQKIDTPPYPCQKGNLFFCTLPLDAPALSFSVNGKDTGALPTDLIYRLENSLEGTTSRLSFIHLDTGREITLIEDLDQFTQSRPEDVGVFIGTEEQIRPCAIVSGLRLIDDAAGLRALADASGGTIDFTVAGTNTVPLAVELIDMLSRGQNRAFLRDVIRMGSSGRIGKIWRNANGTLLLSFRGYSGLRPFLSSMTYGVNNAKVSIISSAVQNSRQWAGILRSVGGRIPVISYVIVGVFDVAEWLAQPAAERELSDLAGQLIVDISKVAISTIAAAAAGAAVIAVAGAFSISAPILFIIGAGILAGIAVGVALDMVDARFGITGHVKNLAGEFGPSLEHFMQRRSPDISITDPELYEGMTTAP